MSIYLDYNATASLRPEVASHMQEISALPANPSSVHSYGREAKKHLEDARKIIAENISAFPNEIIFTATGSEANSLALKGISGRKIFVSAIEHSSVLKHGNIIPVDENGIINIAALDEVLAANGQPALVSVMLANNETGVIQPIAEVVATCKKHSALLHTDAVQALGKISLDFSLLGADMMTLSAHKFGGPIGGACLVVKQNLAINPLISGGGQELGRRAGTENLAAICGFAKAVEMIDFAHMKKLRGWLDNMEDELGAEVFGKPVERLPNTSCIAMPGVGSEVQLMNFDLAGFAISAGSACSSGRIEPSHVLAAMKVPENLAKCAIRISGGWNTKEAEISSFTAAGNLLANGSQRKPKSPDTQRICLLYGKQK